MTMTNNNHIRITTLMDTAKYKAKVRVEIHIHSVIGITVKMGIDNLSGNECLMVTSIVPVIKEMEIKQDIAFNGMLRVNMNNTMITLRPKHKIRTRITADNEETIG